MTLIDVRHVTITYKNSLTPAVSDVSVTLAPGERLGIVGESGSGKSTLAAAITKSLPAGSTLTGSIHYKDTDIYALGESEFRSMRSTEIARIPQDPLASLNPVLRIDRQMSDVISAHQKRPRAEQIRIIESLLADVGLPEPSIKRRLFPHELSGGMRQRVLIALGLINEPGLLIADEPTTALDVTVQAQIIDLLRRELDHRNMALLLITHDIGVVAELCDRIIVMRRGVCVESGETAELMRNPRHEYTQRLFAAASAMPIGEAGELT